MGAFGSLGDVGTLGVLGTPSMGLEIGGIRGNILGGEGDMGGGGEMLCPIGDTGG